MPLSLWSTGFEEGQVAMSGTSVSGRGRINPFSLDMSISGGMSQLWFRGTLSYAAPASTPSRLLCSADSL